MRSSTQLFRQKYGEGILKIPPPTNLDPLENVLIIVPLDINEDSDLAAASWTAGWQHVQVSTEKGVTVETVTP